MRIRDLSKQRADINLKARLFILIVFLTAFLSPVSARTLPATELENEPTIFTLDWQAMPLDSVLPRYTEVIPLVSDYRLYDYSVSILYPEWKEMTKAESRKMQQWADSVSEDLRIRSYVGVMRGQGLLDVDFIPVVKRDGKYLKLVSAKMEIRANENVTANELIAPKARKAAAKVSERYARNSRLASGRWVKVSIKEDGMYRLTRSALQQMGFSKPENVHLYGYGGHRLDEVSNPQSEYDDLEEVPLYQSDNNTWLFWGNGLVHWDGEQRIFNPYASAACYFLTEESEPGRMSTIDGTSQNMSEVVSTFTDHVLYEKDEFAYAQMGRNLFEQANFANNNVRSYKLTTPVDVVGEAKLTVVFTAASNAKTSLQTEVNGNMLAQMNVDALGKYQAGRGVSKTFDVTEYKSGRDWNVRMASTQGHEAHLDYLSLSYLRDINPGQSFVAFNGNTTRQTTFRISGYTDAHEVMRVGTPGSPACLVKGTASSGTFTFCGQGGSERFVCFNKSYAYPQPIVVGVVENQNLHALDSLDMVIIIPESGRLEAEARRLAVAHAQYDGLRVGIVRADQVYNEFSSGTPDATAYRRLMKMLYDRADGNESLMPRYLLLMGKCTFDNRMLTPSWQRQSPSDYLLCFESENSFSDTESYVMEDYFGLLDDGEGRNLTRDKVDIGVGRFPVTSAAEARVMVDKVLDFISNQNAGAWKNVVTMLGDDGDSNSHMRYADDVAERIISRNPELEVKKVMWDAYQRVSTLSTNTYPEVYSLINKQLEDGVMLVNYTGHGAPYVLSHEAVWHTSDFTSFHSRNLPVWFTAACDTAPFDGQTVNMGEEAVLTEGGGALAFIGTTRTVYASNNWNLNRYFSRYVFDIDSHGRRYALGDAMRLTKCDLAETEGNNRENKLQYAILGDPALVIGAPLNRVKLLSLTHTQTGDAVDELKAGMPVTLEGEVQDKSGTHLSRFNGTLSLRVYDSMDTLTCRRNDTSIDNAFVFTDRSSVLYTGQDSVRHGRFRISFIVPKDIKYSNAEGRMVFYAINDSLNIEANGCYEDFRIGGSVDTDDNTGPQIELALNGEPGGTVNSSPYLVARIMDESGVNVTGNGVGHDILLSIDNNPAWTYVLNEYYIADFGDFTKGSLAFTIPELPGGPHTLSLRAWDLLNNTSVSHLDFNVDRAYEPTILHVAASPSPALTYTTFLISCDLPGTVCRYTVEVFDFAGRRLWMHEGEGSSDGQFRIPWNLRVGGGYGRISPGIYLYRVSLQAGDSQVVSKSQKLIVH